MQQTQTYQEPATVDELRDRYEVAGLSKMPTGRRRTFAPVAVGKGNHCPVYGSRGGRRESWPSVKEAAAGLGVSVNTVVYHLDQPMRLRGLRLSRSAPPASEAEVMAEQDRLAAVFVRVPPGGKVGAAVLAARAAVAARKEQP